MTNTRTGRINRLSAVVLALLTSSLWALPAAAQERQAAAVELAAGWIGFPDEGELVHEGVVGGAGRWYLSRRVSVGPELTYIQGDEHSHVVLTGNVTFDLLSPPPTGKRRVTPFIVTGGGLFQTRETFFGSNFTHNEG